MLLLSEFYNVYETAIRLDWKSLFFCVGVVNSSIRVYKHAEQLIYFLFFRVKNKRMEMLYMFTAAPE